MSSTSCIKTQETQADIVDRLHKYNEDWRTRASSAAEVKDAIVEIETLRPALKDAIEAASAPAQCALPPVDDDARSRFLADRADTERKTPSNPSSRPAVTLTVRASCPCGTGEESCPDSEGRPLCAVSPGNAHLQARR